MPVADEKIPRRDAINYLLGAGIGALGAATVFPIARYIIPPAASGSGSSSLAAAKVGELKPNEGKIFKFGNAPGILVLKPGGDPASALSYAAFTAVCTHLNCTVQYRDDLKEIWCACHNGHFDLNGKVISGPPPEALREYRVAIKGDEIFVSSEEA
ncbi:MAG: Rieske (2Fe-2S) protein [Candidatus Zixiibacteriota bacterium]|nr:MAG: Rieske (2Fe-2S) protein [candidate division Zixibacteria bacterium]